MGVKDIGIWTAVQNGPEVSIQSSDFTHDVILSISGDFKDSEEEFVYAKHIAQRLNNTR
jgi:hypothetical protein